MNINLTDLLFSRVKIRSYHKLVLLSTAVVLSFLYFEYINAASVYATARPPLKSFQKLEHYQKVAFDIERAAPNEMTPEKSEEMLKVQREHEIITDDSVNNSSPSPSSTQDEPTETNAAQPEGFDAQKAEYNQKKLYSRNDTGKTIQAIVITLGAFIVIVGIALLAIRAKSSKKK